MSTKMKKTASASNVPDETKASRRISKKKSVKLQPDATKQVTLPPGKLGVVFCEYQKSLSTGIYSVKEDSPVRDLVHVGLVADQLKLPNGTEFSGLSPTELMAVLSETDDLEGRVLVLKSPDAPHLSKKSTTKIILPSGYLGIRLDGSPLCVAEVMGDSPLQDVAWPGQGVLAMGVGDDEYKDLDAEKAVELLESSFDDGQCWMLLENTPPVMELPDEVTVTLPAAPVLGVKFHGSPPVIRKVSFQSPVKADFLVGLAVDTLTLANGSVLMEMTTPTLVKTLKETSGTTGRVVVLKNPATREMTKLPDEVTVTLPAAPVLGVKFHGSPPVIDHVSVQSPVKADFLVGLAVDTLTLANGSVLMEMTTPTLVKTLKETSATTGRVVVLKNPATREMTKLPDEVTVTLPAAPVLGVKFHGSPPVIDHVSLESPVKTDFLVGLAVDTLTLANGAVLMELTTPTLVKTLKETSATTGRVVVLKNPATREMTQLPETMTVELPPDKFGTSFEGSPPMISGFSEDSPMAKKFLVGMVVHQLILADGTVLSDLTNLELAKALKQSTGTEGRKFVLKNPAVESSLSEASGNNNDDENEAAAAAVNNASPNGDDDKEAS